jgi:hypothetical protein
MIIKKRHLKSSIAITVMVTLIGAVALSVLTQRFAIQRHDPDDNAYWIRQFEEGRGESQLTAVSVLAARRPYHDEVLGVLQKALYAEDRRVRMLAVVALAEQGSFEREIAKVSTEDRDAVVREVAKSVLMQRVHVADNATTVEPKTPN